LYPPAPNRRNPLQLRKRAASIIGGAIVPVIERLTEIAHIQRLPADGAFQKMIVLASRGSSRSDGQ